MVDVGEMAPAFAMAGTTTDGLRLEDLRGETRAMLIFYPKDRTSG